MFDEDKPDFDDNVFAEHCDEDDLDEQLDKDIDDDDDAENELMGEPGLADPVDLIMAGEDDPTDDDYDNIKTNTY